MMSSLPLPFLRPALLVERTAEFPQFVVGRGFGDFQDGKVDFSLQSLLVNLLLKVHDAPRLVAHPCVLIDEEVAVGLLAVLRDVLAGGKEKFFHPLVDVGQAVGFSTADYGVDAIAVVAFDESVSFHSSFVLKGRVQALPLRDGAITPHPSCSRSGCAR